MAIEFRCTVCNRLLSTADDKAGRQANCPECGTRVTVPFPEGADYDIGAYDEFEDDDDDDMHFESSPPASRFDEVFTDPPPRSVYRSTVQKPCPVCGEMVQRAAVRCRHCGEDFASDYAERTRMMSPHRGGLVLALSLTGLLMCPICAPFGWAMGNNDVEEIRSGRMDPAGEGLSQAGKIIGIIGTVFWGLLVALAVIGAMA